MSTADGRWVAALFVAVSLSACAGSHTGERPSDGAVPDAVERPSDGAVLDGATIEPSFDGAVSDARTVEPSFDGAVLDDATLDARTSLLDAFRDALPAVDACAVDPDPRVPLTGEQARCMGLTDGACVTCHIANDERFVLRPSEVRPPPDVDMTLPGRSPAECGVCL